MNTTPDPIEDALRRYRPAGPPATLRDRVLVTAQPGRAWPWAAAAAALLAVTLGVQAASRATWRETLPLTRSPALTSAEREALVDAGVDERSIAFIAWRRERQESENAGAGESPWP